MRTAQVCCLVAIGVLLAGCSGVRGASDYAKREAYAANFDQIPLVPDEVQEGRVLNMFVFSGPAETPVRDGYSVPFAVGLSE
ncbi:MAG: hypothetical protein AAGH74_01240 [Pseudomonadota bacterium]